MANAQLKLVEVPVAEIPRAAPPKTPAIAPPRAAWRDWVDARAAAILPPVLMLIVLIGVWQALCSAPDARFPSPVDVWTESHDVIMQPLKGVSFTMADGFSVGEGADVGILVHIATSLRRVAIGYSLAAVTGIALGVLIGSSVFAFRALDPLFQVLRTVPPLAWLPLSLAAFQQANPATVFLIFITAIWPIILNTAVGVQTIPQAYRNVARVLALSKPRYFFKVLLPASVPYMFTGLRIGVGMSWLAIVAAEMVQGGTGIGFFIWDSYNSSLLTDTIVALVYIGLVGFALDRLVAFAGRKISREG
jgi:nitrate/nitrite transport system permease protein